MNRFFLSLLTCLLLVGLVLGFVGCRGDGSSEVSFHPATDPDSSPDAVISISAVSGNNTVALAWSSVSTATTYSISRSISSGETGTNIASVQSASFVDTGVTNGTTYYYLVDAMDGSSLKFRSSQVAATPASPSGSIVVSGEVKYQDKEYGLSGFTGVQPYKAVRYATVELVTQAGVFSALTDSSGLYSITTTTTAGTAYVRVIAEATLSGSSPQVTVKHPDTSGSIYAVISNNFVASGSSTVNTAVPTSLVGGAFNILDVLTNGIEFVHSLSGTYPSALLSAYWQTNNSYGTYYCTGGCPAGDGIYVYNYPGGDTDEYDDDVIYHEFAHFTADNFSMDDSPGGYHYLSDNDLDMRLTWSEGWGNFFPGAIKESISPDLLSTAPTTSTSVYTDTSGSSGWSFDIGNPIPPYGYPVDTFMYSTSEIAIAKSLLDIRTSFGMNNIWDVFSSSNFKARTPRINLEAFWDSWILLGKPLTAGPTTMQSILGNRRIYYMDETVSDNTFADARPIPVISFPTQTTHYLYAGGDEDIFSFTTTTNQDFTIMASNLKNGADPVITVYDADELFVGSNDNWMPISSTLYSNFRVPSDNFTYLCESYYGPCHENAESKLSAKIGFKATRAGTYYVTVKSSTYPPVSAGRYGTYTLSLTSP